MNIITLLIIGLVIYGLISGVGNNAKKWMDPEGFPRPQRRQTRGPGSFREMLEEWVREAQEERPNWEKPYGGGQPQRPSPTVFDDRKYRPRTDRTYSSLEGESTEGMQGDEGRPGIEGTAGTEGSRQSISRNSEPAEAAPRQEGVTPSVQVKVDEQALLQGVVWAEILGRPRALKPFRGPRS